MNVETLEEKQREARIRRALKAYGLILRKSRSRTERHPSHGRYHIVDAARNVSVAGFSPWTYSLTLDDVEKYLNAD